MCSFTRRLGGLTGRIVLALLLIVGMGRRLMLRMLQIPGVLILPLTYLMLYQAGRSRFFVGHRVRGDLSSCRSSASSANICRKFSPMHLRGTGGSFATNVGGRMIGTSAAFLTPKIAQMFTGSPYDQMANAAGCVGLGIAIIAVVLGFSSLTESRIETNESAACRRLILCLDPLGKRRAKHRRCRRLGCGAQKELHTPVAVAEPDFLRACLEIQHAFFTHLDARVRRRKNFHANFRSASEADLAALRAAALAAPPRDVSVPRAFARGDGAFGDHFPMRQQTAEMKRDVGLTFAMLGRGRTDIRMWP